MDKIATHNSATGERSGGLLSFLATPFARCQDKTIAEQYKAGARLFDIRIRHTSHGWRFAHGLWTSSVPVCYVLSNLNLEAFKQQEKATLIVTYEGSCPDRRAFVDEVNSWQCYVWIDVAEVNIKKPKWLTLVRHSNVRFTQCFRVLDFRSWHTLIPIPRLWAKFYTQHEVPANSYRMVDFLN